MNKIYFYFIFLLAATSVLAAEKAVTIDPTLAPYAWIALAALTPLVCWVVRRSFREDK